MYSGEWALQVALFAAVATFTPGPNAVLLLSLGASYGLRPTIAAAVGVWAGIPSLIIVVGAGIVGLASTASSLRLILHLAATAYLGWMAWTVLRMKPPGDEMVQVQPVSFLHAAALQWVNPKVWTMAAGASGAYAIEGTGIAGALIIGAIFAAVCLPAVAMWTLFGVSLRKLLKSPARFTAFKVCMAGSLVVSVALSWIP